MESDEEDAGPDGRQLVHRTQHGWPWVTPRRGAYSAPRLLRVIRKRGAGSTTTQRSVVIIVIVIVISSARVLSVSALDLVDSAQIAVEQGRLVALGVGDLVAGHDNALTRLC